MPALPVPRVRKASQVLLAPPVRRDHKDLLASPVRSVQSAQRVRLALRELQAQLELPVQLALMVLRD